MNVELEGLIPRELVAQARAGKIFPHLICGVDVYRTLEAAAEDGAPIDESRIACESRLPNTLKYFSNRHFRILHLLDDGSYDPQSTIPELRARLRQLGARGANVLSASVLEHDDIGAAYFLTPLTEEELKELIQSSPQHPLSFS